MLRAPLPDSKPRILCNFLTTDEDRASMLAGMKLALEIAAQEPLRAVERAPFSVPESDSDEDLMAFVRRAGQSVYHPASHLRDGLGRRLRAARLRLRGAAGGRRVGDAGDHARQHERAGDHDRGARR